MMTPAYDIIKNVSEISTLSEERIDNFVSESAL